MSKKKCRILAVVMLAAAVLFILFAFNNPQASFPWSNTITYALYGIYVIVMSTLLIVSFNSRKTIKGILILAVVFVVLGIFTILYLNNKPYLYFRF